MADPLNVVAIDTVTLKLSVRLGPPSARRGNSPGDRLIITVGRGRTAASQLVEIEVENERRYR
jgi:hypothetical protein